jgi:hypothetical protein
MFKKIPTFISLLKEKMIIQLFIINDINSTIYLEILTNWKKNNSLNYGVKGLGKF